MRFAHVQRSSLFSIRPIMCHSLLVAGRGLWLFAWCSTGAWYLLKRPCWFFFINKLISANQWCFLVLNNQEEPSIDYHMLWESQRNNKWIVYYQSIKTITKTPKTNSLEIRKTQNLNIKLMAICSLIYLLDV